MCWPPALDATPIREPCAHCQPRRVDLDGAVACVHALLTAPAPRARTLAERDAGQAFGPAVLRTVRARRAGAGQSWREDFEGPAAHRASLAAQPTTPIRALCTLSVTLRFAPLRCLGFGLALRRNFYEADCPRRRHRSARAAADRSGSQLSPLLRFAMKYAVLRALERALPHGRNAGGGVLRCALPCSMMGCPTSHSTVFRALQGTPFSQCTDGDPDKQRRMCRG